MSGYQASGRRKRTPKKAKIICQPPTGVDIIILGKSAITHSKESQSSPNPKNIEEHKNSLGHIIDQKCVTAVVSEKTV